MLVNIVYGQFSEDAQKFIRESEPLFKKIALVVDGAFQKMMSSFYVGNVKPKGVDIQMFKTKEEAVGWLKG